MTPITQLISDTNLDQYLETKEDTAFFHSKGEHYDFNESVRLFQPGEIVEMTELKQLKKIMLFGDYEMNTFDANTSPRMIFVFQKQ